MLLSVDDLLKLYKQRLRDRQQSRTKRRRATEASLQPMKGLLENYFQGDAQALQRIEESRAIMAWETYVGDAAARASQAQRIRGKQLIVRVKDPIWMQQLTFLKGEILRRYAREFPRLKLTDIFFTRN